MRFLGRSQTLDRRNRKPLHVAHRQSARRHRLAVDDDLARAALLQAATDLGAFQAQIVAQDIDQGRLGLYIDAMDLAIDFQRNFARHKFLRRVHRDVQLHALYARQLSTATWCTPTSRSQLGPVDGLPGSYTAISNRKSDHTRRFSGHQRAFQLPGSWKAKFRYQDFADSQPFIAGTDLF